MREHEREREREHEKERESTRKRERARERERERETDHFFPRAPMWHTTSGTVTKYPSPPLRLLS